MNIRGFRSEAEMREYLEGAGIRDGYWISAQATYDLSIDWYRGRMEEEWEPWTADQARSIFESNGLKGPFWEFS